MTSTARLSFSTRIVSYIVAASLTVLPCITYAAEEKKADSGKSGAQQIQSKTASSHEFKNEEEKVNYAIGVQMAGNFQRQGHKVNVDMVAKGMRDALSGKGLALPDGELRRLIMIYQNAVKRGYMQQKKDAAEKKQ